MKEGSWEAIDSLASFWIFIIISSSSSTYQFLTIFICFRRKILEIWWWRFAWKRATLVSFVGEKTFLCFSSFLRRVIISLLSHPRVRLTHFRSFDMLSSGICWSEFAPYGNDRLRSCRRSVFHFFFFLPNRNKNNPLFFHFLWPYEHTKKWATFSTWLHDNFTLTFNWNVQIDMLQRLPLFSPLKNHVCFFFLFSLTSRTCKEMGDLCNLTSCEL